MKTLAVIIALFSIPIQYQFAQGPVCEGLELEYDAVDHYIHTFADMDCNKSIEEDSNCEDFESGMPIMDWAEYEIFCIQRNMDPTYEEYIQFAKQSKVTELFTGHCDFEAMAAQGVDEFEELSKLGGWK